MELNSLLILLEAAEYLERRDREAEHGYASVLPYTNDFSRKKTKASPMSRKTQNNRSSHNELEKHRYAAYRAVRLGGCARWLPIGSSYPLDDVYGALPSAAEHTALKEAFFQPKAEEHDSGVNRVTSALREGDAARLSSLRAKLRLYLEQLKKLVPLGPDSTRHTTLSLLKRAKMHIKKLEEQDRKALNTKEQLQREHRYLKRRLEQLSVSGSVERIRTDSMGSTISTDSEQEVDIEGVEFTPVEADSVDSISDGEEEEEEDQYGLQSSSSDTSYTATHSHRL
ncbi:unnamed protein product, partial [Tetraodon nigroviridis]